MQGSACHWIGPAAHGRSCVPPGGYVGGCRGAAGDSHHAVGAVTYVDSEDRVGRDRDRLRHQPVPGGRPGMACAAGSESRTHRLATSRSESSSRPTSMSVGSSTVLCSRRRSSRSPTARWHAAQHFEGRGLIVIGLEPGNLVGAPEIDPAELHNAIQPYLADPAPRWDVQYLTYKGKQVHVVAVTAPQPASRSTGRPSSTRHRPRSALS